MPGSSNGGVWTYLDDDAFEADYPVSTGYSWTLRDNFAHLIDSAGQYRVSWVGKSGRGDSYPFAYTTATAYWTETFPLTLWSQDGGTGVYTRIRYRSSDAGRTITLTAKYMWDSEPFDSTNVLHSFTDTTTTTSAAGELVENTRVLGLFGTAAGNGAVAGPGRRTFPITEGSVDHQVEVYMARLVLKFDTTSGGGESPGAELLGVQVIEFPVWP